MNKKFFTVIGILILSATIGFSIENSKDQPIYYNKKKSFEVTYLIPSELKDLENRSTHIVKGKFIGKREEDKDAKVIGPSTISKFKIETIYKGKIQTEEIDVLEPFEIEGDSFINIDGYLPMNEKEEYLLFLRENQINLGNQYTIISINFGKYSLSKKKNASYMKVKPTYLQDVETKEFITQSQDKADLYNSLKNDILIKYK